jgi:hypothetical protein
MDKYSTLGMLCKRQIKNHCEKLCRALPRPKHKLVTQMMYGLSHSKDCKLTEIGRGLMETIPIKKTVERLRIGLAKLSEAPQLMDRHLDLVRDVVDEKSLFILDNSDITKPYGHAGKGLCTVRDGDTGELGRGYHVLEVAALTQTHKMPVPLYSHIYSSEEKSFVSEDAEILKALEMLSSAFGRKGVRVMDRGYDTLTYYRYFIKHKEAFVIRCKKNRDVIHKGKTRNILSLANTLKGKYRLDYTAKNGQKHECKVSMVPVRLPKYPKAQLLLVVVHGFGREPMMLLSNLSGDDARLCTSLTKVYLLRWRIEEYFRFKKQQFQFEDIRVRSLAAIRSLNAILTCLVGLYAMLSEKVEKSRFVMDLIEQAKRVDSIFKRSGKLKFIFYSFACAFASILRKSHVPFVWSAPPHSKRFPLQLSFL